MEKKEIKSQEYNKFWKAMEGIIPEVADRVHKEVKDLVQRSYKEGLEKGKQEIDKAREEGRRESKQEISGYFSKTEGEHILERGKEYVVISRELYDKLSKLRKER